MYSLRTKRRGLTLLMTYHNSPSFRRKLPDPTVGSDARKLRIGVLASGGGTTLQAILDACAQGHLHADVAVVISNNRGSGALARAQACSVRAVHLSSKTHPDADALDGAILGQLRDAQVDLVVLAGFMKKVGPRTLAAYSGRVLNTHPALLPKYGGKGMYGRRVYEAVLAAGETETGVTVHQVDAEYDHGLVVAQIAVPIEKDDNVDTLAARVQAVERSFLVETLQQIIACN
jgi:phosphoribosylglycinamide formyltransferase-1